MFPKETQHLYKLLLLSSLARSFLRKKEKTMITKSYYLFSVLIVIKCNCLQSSSFVVYLGSMLFKMRLVHPRLFRSSRQQKLTLGWNFVRKKCFQKSILKQKEREKQIFAEKFQDWSWMAQKANMDQDKKKFLIWKEEVKDNNKQILSKKN